MNSVGKYNFSKCKRSARGGVMTEIILIIPNVKIITAGKIRANSFLPRHIKLKHPKPKGSQNSKTRYNKVVAKP